MLHVRKLPSTDGHAQYTAVEETDLTPWSADESLRWVGRPHPRVEADAKVTGRARYAYDVRLPRQLFARVLRSPHPHVRIRRIDTSRAEALPGVHAVLSVANAPDQDWYPGGRLFDQTLRFVGDEVAVVAAESQEIAEDALRLIEVEYESLPFVLDLDAALRSDAPRVHPDGNRAGDPKIYVRGDPEEGFRHADVTVDQTYTTQTALHNCMEPHGCTATWEDGRLTLWESTQSVFQVRERVAAWLGLPEHHVRVIKQFMGGGFGSKQVAWKHAVIAALLSRQAGRPVQVMLDREAENLAAGNRNATRQRVRIGATRDGVITAIDARIEQQVGAYLVGGEGSFVSGIYQTLYRCPNVRTEQVGVHTNTGPAVAFRAPGHVEGAFALECALDELARALAMDPLELRLRNYADEDGVEALPYSTPEGLRRCYERAGERFGWDSRERRPAEGSKRRGVGIAAHDWGGGGHAPGYAWVKVNTDGTVDVVTGTQDIGTGTRTGLTLIAAEELGIAPEQVSLHLGDTALGPYAPVSAGSATQATIGPAVRAAAADARHQLVQVATAMLDAPPEELELHDGAVSVRGAPNHRVTIEEIAHQIAPAMIQGRGAREPNPSALSVSTFGAQMVEVEIDTETGEVTVLRIVAAHDCGRIVDPTLVDSQVVGGVIQGIGFALTEERTVDAVSGVVLNANLEEYKVPTVADVPPIVHAHVNLPDPAANITGAKGIGEPPLVPTAPAIANAVFDATGVRVRDLPLTRRRVLSALSESGGLR